MLLVSETENASFYCCWFSTTLEPNTPTHCRIGAHQTHYGHAYTQLRLHVMLCTQKSSVRMNGQHKRCFSLFGSVATDEQVEKSKHSGFARCVWFVNQRTSHKFHRPIKKKRKTFTSSLKEIKTKQIHLIELSNLVWVITENCWIWDYHLVFIFGNRQETIRAPHDQTVSARNK